MRCDFSVILKYILFSFKRIECLGHLCIVLIQNFVVSVITEFSVGVFSAGQVQILLQLDLCFGNRCYCCHADWDFDVYVDISL